MAITNKLEFKTTQLKKFARLFRTVRKAVGMSQLNVARAAFDYDVSHCKVSRVERVAMPRVDAHAIAQIAVVLGIPVEQIEAIDPDFKRRWEVTQAASERGFWAHPAKLPAVAKSGLSA